MLTLSADDESAIRSVASAFVDSWNRHDMAAMHQLNTDDVEWINITGNHWRGNDVVYKGHDTIHRTIFSKTNARIDDLLPRAIAPGAAIAVAAMAFGPALMPSGETVAEVKSRGSFVLVKRDTRWEIVHFHNTIMDAEAQLHDPVTWGASGYLPRGAPEA
jgi:uncharacterized protein (TIGR02246 family)